MNLKRYRDEFEFGSNDYHFYLDSFHASNKPITDRELDKIKTQATTRPFTANQMVKSLKFDNGIQKTDYIEDLIKRKTLLNIQYQALKGQPKFQSFLLGINYDTKAKKYEREQSHLRYTNAKEEQQQVQSGYKSARIYNSLGIKRNKSATRMRQRNNPQLLVKSPLFNQNYKPLNHFPVRKNSILKLKLNKYSEQKGKRFTQSNSNLINKLLHNFSKDINNKQAKNRFKSTSHPKQTVKFANERLAKQQKLIQGIKMIIHR